MDSENAGSIYAYDQADDAINHDEAEDPDYYPKKLSLSSNVDNDNLSHLQKILLMTDGTVTELLEHLAGEPVVVEKVYQELENNADNIPASHRDSVSQGMMPCLIRKIILKGRDTNKNYIYAESTILVDSLPEIFRAELIDSQTPIGKLWSKHKLETYKTDFVAERENASKEVSGCLSIPIDSELLSRTYSVYSSGMKSMIITEKFSSSLFAK